jgi:phage-related protein
MTNAAIANAIQEISPSALIELFQLELNVTQHGVAETYYFHAGTNSNDYQELIWNAQPYMALPIEVEGFEYSGQGTLPRPKMRISNLMGTITALILTLPEGLEGAKLTRIRTLARFIDGANFKSDEYLLTEDGFALMYEDDTFIYQEVGNPFGAPDPTAEFPREIFFVDRKSAENRDVVEFELASAFDMAGIRAPKRQCITRCQWVYRSAECSYTGTNYFNASDAPVGNASEDVCGKRVDSCKARFGQNAELPHGGFVGIGSYFA